MRRAVLLALALALAVAGCADERGRDPLAPPGAAAAPAGGAAGRALAVPVTPELAAPATAAAAGPAEPAAAARGPVPAAARDVPQIYMALQPDAGGPTSVILAIDASRDNTPSNDPAVRITPDNGACNPQQLRYFNFPPERAQRPIYGPEQAARGVTARELPDFMAMAVTSEMMTAGLIDDPDESKPQNVCTRKLLQRLIIDRSTAAG